MLRFDKLDISANFWIGLISSKTYILIVDPFGSSTFHMDSKIEPAVLAIM
jgi:hypothetical protein